MVEEFNARIKKAHYDHYIDGSSGLIDSNINASPNTNQIYHLYSTGKITHQKGAWAYLERSEFDVKGNIFGAKNMAFKFPLNQEDISYAILTQEECNTFRKEMENMVSKM
jgi:hypothetical protein